MTVKLFDNRSMLLYADPENSGLARLLAELPRPNIALHLTATSMTRHTLKVKSLSSPSISRLIVQVPNLIISPCRYSRKEPLFDLLH